MDKQRAGCHCSRQGEAIIWPGTTSNSFRWTPTRAVPGTSTNMNVNEVMANVALELETGHALGQYDDRSNPTIT